MKNVDFPGGVRLIGDDQLVTYLYSVVKATVVVITPSEVCSSFNDSLFLSLHQLSSERFFVSLELVEVKIYAILFIPWVRLNAVTKIAYVRMALLIEFDHL